MRKGYGEGVLGGGLWRKVKGRGYGEGFLLEYIGWGFLGKDDVRGVCLFFSSNDVIEIVNYICKKIRIFCIGKGYIFMDC